MYITLTEQLISLRFRSNTAASRLDMIRTGSEYTSMSAAMSDVGF